MASNKVFHTSGGWEIHLFPIHIQLGDLAFIKCIQMSSMGMYEKTYTLEGEDYTRWGNDDEYIKHYVCDKERYLGQPVPDVDVSGNPIKYVSTVIKQDDGKSVHNDADVAKIETLQTQLDEQQKKLKTITDLLINKGMI